MGLARAHSSGLKRGWAPYLLSSSCYVRGSSHGLKSCTEDALASVRAQSLTQNLVSSISCTNSVESCHLLFARLVVRPKLFAGASEQAVS